MELPSGDQGTRETLRIMRSLAHQGATQLEVRETAITALRAAGARPHDRLGELAALHNFVRDQIRFTRDPHGIETLQGPRYTLKVKAGDCDDRATLLAAMAKAIGIPTRFKAIGADPRRPGRFSHVYVVAEVNGKRVAADPTYNETPLGWEHPGATRAMELPV